MENLYLKWIDYKTNKKYVIGALCRDSKNNKYYFKLNENYIDKAKEAGFTLAVLPFQMLIEFMKVIFYFLFLK